MLHPLGVINIPTAGTAVPLSSTRIACTWFLVQALGGNSGTVYVGDSTVGNGTTSNGVRLVQSASQTFPFSGAVSPYDLQTIYVNSDNNNDKVVVVYFRS